MEVKKYDCQQCGAEINFAGETSVICQVCGISNELVKQEEAALEAITSMEQMLGGKIVELERRFKASGDAEARDYIFRKDYLPRLDVIFENLTEKFDDYFRRPIFQINLLKKYNPLYNVEKVFKLETKKGFSEDFTHELNQFARRQLEFPIMNLLAASNTSKTHIEILRHHIMFLSNLFVIRGKALEINADSITAVLNLMELAIEHCQILMKLYIRGDCKTTR